MIGALPWFPVLMYHRVVRRLEGADPHRNCISVASFARQLGWLARRGYRSLSFADLARIVSGRGDAPGLPGRPLMITFDDGYADNHDLAWPLLQRHGFTATVFVVTDAIGGDNGFDGGPVRVPMLGAEQIRAMHAAGIEFGSHTCSHPPSLTELTDPALVHELSDSRRCLESLIQAEVTALAYPHSKFDARVESATAAAGYALACAGVAATAGPLRVPRVHPPRGGGPALQLAMGWRHLKHEVKNRC